MWYPSVEDIVVIHDGVVSEYPDTPSGTQNRGDTEFALDYIEEGTLSSAPETIHKRRFTSSGSSSPIRPSVDANERTTLNAAAVFYFLNGYRFEYDDEIRSLLKRFGTDEASVDTEETSSIFELIPKCLT